jgi:hypothetical protein
MQFPEANFPVCSIKCQLTHPDTSEWRRMGDSNPRGLSPNTLSKRAP